MVHMYGGPCENLVQTYTIEVQTGTIFGLECTESRARVLGRVHMCARWCWCKLETLDDL